MSRRIIVHAVSPQGTQNICDGTREGHCAVSDWHAERLKGCTEGDCRERDVRHRRVTCVPCLVKLAKRPPEKWPGGVFVGGGK